MTTYRMSSTGAGLVKGLPLLEYRGPERGNYLKPEHRGSSYESIDLADRYEGQRRRDAGVAEVELAEGVIWKSKADAAIIMLASSGEDFTADDVRRLAGSPRHPNAMGARLLKASRGGHIKCVDLDRSKRPEGHARVLRVWRAA